MRASRVPPSPAIFNALLAAHTARGGAAEGEEVFHRLTAAGLPASPACFATLMAAHARDGCVAGARSLFLRMRSQGLPPSVEVYTALLAAHARAGEPEAAAAVFEELLADAEVQADAAAWAAAIDSQARAGRVDAAWQLYRQQKVCGAGCVLHWV